jgi:hypothetical protein
MRRRAHGSGWGWTLALGLALGSLGWQPSVAAAAEEGEPPPASKPAPKGKPSPMRVIRLKGDIIEGRVQKPEAFYVLQRTSMSFEGLKLQTRLIPKILDALRKSPF